MKLKSKQAKALLVISAASLIGGTIVATTASAEENLGRCYGINSCKGQSGCDTVNNSCAGRNSCKGKGWITSDKKTCDKKGGEFKTK